MSAATSAGWRNAGGWIAALWFFALAANARLVQIDGEVAALASMVLAGGALALALVVGRLTAARWRLAAALALALLWLASSAASAEPQLLLGLALAAAWLASREEDARRWLAAPAWGYAVYALLALADDHLLWSGRLSSPAAVVTRRLRELSDGRLIHGGFEATGLWLLPVAIALWLALAGGGRRHRWRLAALLTLGALAAAVVQLATPRWWMAWWVVPAYLALATLLAAAPPEPAPSGSPGMARALAVVAAVLAAGAAALPLLRGVPEPGGGTVYVHLRTEVSLVPLAWDRPEDNLPKVGRWMRYLERSRVPLRLVDGPLAELPLKAGDALVLIDYVGGSTAEDAAAVESFVRGGGSLLVFADHTNMYGMADRLNQLLAFTHLRVAMDTAVQLRNYWDDSLTLRRHPTTAGGIRPRHVGFGQGASLQAGWPARPLVVGRWSFSDTADWTAPQRLYLGDRLWDRRTERRAGLLLAAEEAVGRGKVLLYGDTSFLQDSSFSLCWPYLDRVVAYALSGDGAGAVDGIAVALLLLALGLALLARWLGWAAASGLLALGLALGIALAQFGEARWSGWRPLLEADARVAEVPMVGVPFFDLFSDEQGVDVFLQDLERSGWLPLLTTDETLGRLPGPALRVVLPRARRVSAGERRRWLADVEAGGLLWVAAGAPERRAVEPLLAALGLGIEDRPLGRSFGERPRHGLPVPAFAERWPLLPPEKAEVWAEAFGRPVILRLRRGAGQILWLGDGKIFLNPWYEERDNSSLFVRVASLVMEREAAS